MINKARLVRITLSFAVAILLAFGVSTALAQARLGPPVGGGSSYGSWHDLMGHYGIQYRLKCEDCSNSTVSKYTWWVEFRNGTGQRVSFDFRIDRVGLSGVRFSDGVAMEPGGTKEGWNQVDASVGAMNLTVYTDHWKYGANAQ